MKILIVDNNIDKEANGRWPLCADFRRYLEGEVTVRRAPQEDLPKDLARFTHVIFTGSKTSILDHQPWIQKVIDLVKDGEKRGLPMLGVCYGHQIIAKTFGGKPSVRKAPKPEFGWVNIEQTGENPLLESLPREFHSFQSHFEEVCSLPQGFVKTAESDRCEIQAYYVEGKPIFGIQFHPEKSGEEGECSIRFRHGKSPDVRDCIFNAGKADSLFSENVANTIFRNFIRRSK